MRVDGLRRIAVLLLAGCSASPELSATTREATDAVGAGAAWRCVFSTGLRHLRGVLVDSTGAPIVLIAPTPFDRDGTLAVKKLADDGSVLWSSGLLGDEGLLFYDGAVDRDGNVVLAGAGARTVHEPGGADRRERGGMLIKIAADGHRLWSAIYPDCVFGRVVIGPNGDIAVRVHFGNLTDNTGVASYAADGTLSWMRILGYKDTVRPHDLAIDGAGRVLIGGWASELVDFGGGPLGRIHHDPDEGSTTDGFLLQVDAANHHLWSRRFGNGRYQAMGRVGMDAEGHVVAILSGRGPVDLGAGPVPGPSITVFDAGGHALWTKPLQGSFWGVDSGGAIVLTGTSPDAIDLGFGQSVGPATAESGNGFAARIGFDGRPIAGSRWAGPGGFNGMRPDGGLVLSGGLTAPIDFGCGVVSPGPDADAFVVTLAPANGGRLADDLATSGGSSP